MKKLSPLVLALIGLLLVLGGVPALIMVVLFGKRLTFSPVAFWNQYFEFLSGLIILLASFLLGNWFWDTKSRRERVRRARRAAVRFFSGLRDVAGKCLARLDENRFAENQVTESEQRDEQVRKGISAMAASADAFRILYPDLDPEKDEILGDAVVDLFWVGILPVLEDLRARESLRGDPEGIDPVRSRLETIRVNADKAVGLLGEPL